MDLEEEVREGRRIILLVRVFSHIAAAAKYKLKFPNKKGQVLRGKEQGK
jgi:hypothetical protein